MPPWPMEDNDAVAATAATRTGSAWPAKVSLPVRGVVDGKIAAQRWSVIRTWPQYRAPPQDQPTCAAVVEREPTTASPAQASALPAAPVVVANHASLSTCATCDGSRLLCDCSARAARRAWLHSRKDFPRWLAVRKLEWKKRYHSRHAARKELMMQRRLAALHRMTLKEYQAMLERSAKEKAFFAKRTAEAKAVLTEQLRRQRAPTDLGTVQTFTGLVVSEAARLKRRVAIARTDNPGTWDERELAAVRSHGHGETDAFEKVAIAIVNDRLARGWYYNERLTAQMNRTVRDWLIANYKANKAAYGQTGDGWDRGWLERRDQDGKWDKIFDGVQDLSGDIPLALLIPQPPRPPSRPQPWGSNWVEAFMGPDFHDQVIAQHQAQRRKQKLVDEFNRRS